MKTLLFLLLLPFAAQAQVVVSCSDDWGSSGSCGGCSGLAFRTPAAGVKVKTTASDFWTRFDSLKPSDTVFTQAGKKEGDAVVCSQATPIKVQDLIGGSTPSPPPAPTPSSPCNTSGCKLSWTAPMQNDDGTPIKAITTYLLSVNGQSQGVGNVLEYVLVRPVGDYAVYLQTVTADGMSKPTNSAVVHVAAAASDPPPIPPPQQPPTPKPILTKTPGLWILKKGTSNVKVDLASEQACEKEIEARATATAATYSCNLSDKYTVKLP